jgi:ABC-2 type transport system ATP-binding protein
MGASQFVGRVGGLAVALGVGAAVFAGAAVASADRSGPDSGTAAGASAGSEQSNAPTRPRRGTSADAPTPRQQTRATSPNSDGSPLPAAAIQTRRDRVATPAATEPTVDTGPDIGLTAPKTVELPDSTPIEVTSPEVAEGDQIDSAPTELAAPGEISEVTLGGVDPTDGAGSDPTAPVGSLAEAFLGYGVRRATVLASATGTPTALVTTSAVTNNGVTVDPSLFYFDGVLQGNLNATSASGNELTYTFVGSSAGGKLDLGTVRNPFPYAGEQSFTLLPYATWINPALPNPSAAPTGTQTFSVRVSELTDFDKFLINIPLVGLIAAPIIDFLQATPFLSDLLAPIIGGSVVAEISVDLDTDVPTGKPVAFTYMVESFDGTPISTNFFPATASSLFPGNYGATLFNGPGLGSPGTTDPYGSSQAAGSTPGLATLRGQGLPEGSGFSVVTWDPRGEGASGGVLQLDNPFFEGRDVSALIDWTLANTPTLQVEGAPLIGMIGGSYGGGIQMTTVDPRIKAIVPAIAWNSLNESLYPSEVFKTAWANTLFLSLLEGGARVNNQIPLGILTGDLFGWLSQTAQAVLASSGPTSLLTKLNVPTLFVQGIVDALFPLQQAVVNAETMLLENPFFSGDNANLVKMIWFCGGHGVCLDPVDQVAQGTAIFTQDMAWLNKYVKGADIPIDLLVPTFQWWDQAGTYYASNLMPFDDDFQSGTVEASDEGGLLGILPLAIGGSGPNTDNCAVASACQFPLNQVFATKADNAINVEITVPNAGTQIVGAPTVSFEYAGLGTTDAVYAQIVDNATGRVLGNIATPIPVTLDGRTRTASVSIANIAYTAPTANSSLTLQIVSGATVYNKWYSLGAVDISNVTVELPTTTAGIQN